MASCCGPICRDHTSTCRSPAARPPATVALTSKMVSLYWIWAQVIIALLPKYIRCQLLEICCLDPSCSGGGWGVGSWPPTPGVKQPYTGPFFFLLTPAPFFPLIFLGYPRTKFRFPLWSDTRPRPFFVVKSHPTPPSRCRDDGKMWYPIWRTFRQKCTHMDYYVVTLSSPKVIHLSCTS